MDVEKLLYEICEDPRVFDPSVDLVETGILDSYGMIELFACLEDAGIELQPTRIDRSLLRSAAGIRQLIEQADRGEKDDAFQAQGSTDVTSLRRHNSGDL